MSEEAGASNDGTASRQVMLICSGIGLLLYTLFGVFAFSGSIVVIPLLFAIFPVTPLFIIGYIIAAVMRRAIALVITGALTLAAQVGLFSMLVVHLSEDYVEQILMLLVVAPFLGLFAMFMAAWFSPTRPSARAYARDH